MRLDLDWEKNYRPANRLIWRGRLDPTENSLRYHQITHCVDLRKRSDMPVCSRCYAIVGFASDEGVRRNQGRVGAAQGPLAFRSSFASLPTGVNNDFILYDVGDIVSDGEDLEAAQEALSKVIAFLFSLEITPIVIGGGHEVAWGHFLGYGKKPPSLLNFDAHFDLRPTLEGGLSSSGSAYHQMAEQLGEKFRYLCCGVQRLGNTPFLFDEAKRLGAEWIDAELFFEEPKQAKEELLEWVKKQDEIFFSHCLDLISSAYAPGVSASQPFGLEPWQLQPLIKLLAQSKKIKSLEIAELNPSFDPDGRTAHLAASLVALYLHST